MTDLSHVHQPGAPYLFVARADRSALTAMFLQVFDALPSSMVRILRGAKCETGRAFFDQASAALQFMPYVGDNWNAFDECLASLWQGGDAVVLFVTDGDRFLADSDVDLGSFVKIIVGANQAYDDVANDVTIDPRAVKVVFGVDGGEGDMIDRLAVHAHDGAVTMLSTEPTGD